MSGKAEEAEEMDQMPDRKRFSLVRKNVVYVSLGMVIAIAVPLVIWLSGQMHAAGKDFDAFSQRLIAKDFNSAYSSTSDEFQSAVSKHEFIGQQTKLCARHGSLKAVKRGGSVPSFNLGGAFTTVDATFIFEKADSRFSFRLKKAGDSWRVYDYEEESAPVM